MSIQFSGPEGGAQIQKDLSFAFSEERFPHAVLLEGEPGSGTDRLAATLAQAAVCLSHGKKPCGVCTGCEKAAAGSHPDIFTVDGDANPRAFPVDTIRQIRSDAYVRPNEAPRRVFVLLGAQNMSEISQNALLKILEEPPQNVLFILTAVSAAALLPTIRSRVQIFSAAGSSMPDDWELAEKIARAVLAPTEAELVFGASGLVGDRETFRGVLRQLSMLFRDALAARSGGTVLLSGREQTVSFLSSGLTRLSLMRMLEETEKAQAALEQNANTALLAADYCARLSTAAGR
ncbi:ATP-binding protein [Thermocaproicibacter melissae]|jgi:hypothetical protein|uniref:DNA polymerase III subunit n=1 Tax=Thermocaproicibacter melissae TaxID=2966552 RepID=UPI0024B05AE9|nr:ATP-binding protein [Thermocaproicibacter melissae]WBY63605.1 ATP-binding protein [Thermocaproicibacter melissae]